MEYKKRKAYSFIGVPLLLGTVLIVFGLLYSGNNEKSFDKVANIGQA